MLPDLGEPHPLSLFGLGLAGNGGWLSEAYDQYLDAESRHTDPRLRWQCALERSAVAHWITGAPDRTARDGDPLVDDVSGYLLAALRGHPARLLARPLPAATPGGTLSRAVAALLDGRTEFAAELVALLIPSEDVFVSLAGRIIAAIIEPACSLAEFRAVATEAAAAGWPWLARVARSATAMADPDGCAAAAAVLAECQEAGDEWGALVSGSLLGIGCLRAGVDGLGPLREAISRSRRLHGQPHGHRPRHPRLPAGICGCSARWARTGRCTTCAIPPRKDGPRPSSPGSPSSPARR
jgi:hypothetical protein